MDSINEKEVKALIDYFSKLFYRPRNADDIAKAVMNKCIELAKLDYNVTLIDNSSGELCAHYPSQLIIMGSENNPSGELIKDTIYECTDPIRLRDLVTRARTARCRARFPVPVIFVQGKFICRSSTLSGGPEIYGRSGLDYFFAGYETYPEQSEEDNNVNGNNWVLCDQVRKDDIKLLKALSVGTIVDFMVEKKKVKFGLNVTSSEKVDKENRYSQFTISSLPYPGCEFFREFRDNNYGADNLFYNWDQAHVDADIIVPQDSLTGRVQISWRDYKKWDLVNLTRNYLLLLLRYSLDSSSSMLLHCISGWDRTPLFVSLLRICLWADGFIHKSLTPVQMLYFTISYDWLLFGHALKDRKAKGEDIFYFCFYFLKFCMGDEFNSQSEKPLLNKNSVIPEEEDMQCDGTEMESETSYPHGSNYSLYSSWSSISSKGQENTPMFQSEDNGPGGLLFCENSASQQSSSSSSSGNTTLTDTSGDSQKLMSTKATEASSTSPVAVPARTSLRQRHESTSSLNVGSWQYVSSTGSLRSNAGSTVSSNSRSSGHDAATNDSMNTDGAPPTDSFLIKRKSSADHSQCGSSCAVRRERLDQMRKLFTTCYCHSVGHKLKDGSDSGLSNIFGNITGKMSRKS